MNAYLLTWKPDEWNYENLRKRIDAFESNEVVQKWSCGSTKNIPLGSRVFLIKQGKGHKGIFGSGHVVELPFEEPHYNDEKRKAGKKNFYVRVKFDRLYDPKFGIKINRLELDSFDSKVWDSQGSGKTIPHQAALKLEELWLERTGSIEIPYADEVRLVESGLLQEGASKKIIVNAYERNPETRERCIKKWGLNCAVCNFHFELFYGVLGKEYIHVHHLMPLSEIREEYEINPEEDLRPVCPNCHSMLHRDKQTLSIVDLKDLVLKYGRFDPVNQTA